MSDPNRSTWKAPLRNPSPFIHAALQLLFVAPAAPILSSLIHFAQQEEPLDAALCDERAFEEGFQGNADFYGLGIRIGIYLQWISTAASFVFFPQVHRGLLGSYLALSLAIFIALLLLIFTRGCTYTAEIIIILYVLSGGWMSALIHYTVKGTKAKLVSDKLSGIDLCFYLVGITTLSVDAWFWLRLALKEEFDFFSTPGGTSMFLVRRIKSSEISKVSIFLALLSIWMPGDHLLTWPAIMLLRHYGFKKISLVAEVLTFEFWLVIICMVYYGIIGIFVALTVVIVGLARGKADQALLWFGTYDWDRKSQLAGCFSLTVIIWTITATELTLKWNHVEDVHEVASTGQLIPLIIGLTLVLSTLWQVYRQKFPVEEDNIELGRGFQLENGLWR